MRAVLRAAGGAVFRFVAVLSRATGFFAFAWDGTTFAGQGQTFTVPDGEYVVTISVLKALGDAHNPAHTETWESPSIILDRP